MLGEAAGGWGVGGWEGGCRHPPSACPHACPNGRLLSYYSCRACTQAHGKAGCAFARASRCAVTPRSSKPENFCQSPTQGCPQQMHPRTAPIIDDLLQPFSSNALMADTPKRAELTGVRTRSRAPMRVDPCRPIPQLATVLDSGLIALAACGGLVVDRCTLPGVAAVVERALLGSHLAHLSLPGFGCTPSPYKVARQCGIHGLQLRG